MNLKGMDFFIYTDAWDVLANNGAQPQMRVMMGTNILYQGNYMKLLQITSIGQPFWQEMNLRIDYYFMGYYMRLLDVVNQGFKVFLDYYNQGVYNRDVVIVSSPFRP